MAHYQGQRVAEGSALRCLFVDKGFPKGIKACLFSLPIGNRSSLYDMRSDKDVGFGEAAENSSLRFALYPNRPSALARAFARRFRVQIFQLIFVVKHLTDDERLQKSPYIGRSLKFFGRQRASWVKPVTYRWRDIDSAIDRFIRIIPRLPFNQLTSCA